MDDLRTEAFGFQMASLPISTTCIDLDEFWASIHSTLLMLIRALQALPTTNADNERCFSKVRRIDSEDRNDIECTTVASLLALKLSADEDYFIFKPSKALFETNKSEDRQYKEGHGSHSNY